MKIGIYTQPLLYNFGGILQNWALQTVLKRMGYEVETINQSPYKLKPSLMIYAKRMVKKYILRQKVHIRAEISYNKYYDILATNIKPFLEKNIQRRNFFNIHEVSEQEYDAIIVGSDQVWRPKYNKSHQLRIEDAFLDFAKGWNILRVAYAPSFGTAEWEYTKEEERNCSELAKLFKHISVREDSGVDLCRDHLKVDASVVLDPTLLLKQEDYETLIDSSQTHSPSGDLLCYFLDENEEVQRLTNLIATTKGLQPFKANSRIADPTAPIRARIQQPIEQWLRNFKEAKFVATDSFHACVFSLIFGKPFVVLGNKDRGMARYDSLLNLFSAKEHLIYSSEEYNQDLAYDIQAVNVNQLEEMRKKSMDFLKNALS